MKKILYLLLFFCGFAHAQFVYQNGSSQPAYDANGNYVGVLTPTYNQAGFYGFVPPTQDYPGIMSAIHAAIASPVAKNVLFEDYLYNLGSNYIPIIGTIGYRGVQLRIEAGVGHSNECQSIVGGSRFTTTAQYAFWDGATTQSSIIATVTPQNVTLTAGSPNITVTTGASYPVGSKAYFTQDLDIFRAGISYFVLSQSGNILTLGYPDMAPINAITSTSASEILGEGFPLDATQSVTMENIGCSGVKTCIQTGAQNFTGLMNSKLTNIYATSSNIAYPLMSNTNFAWITATDIVTNDGNGQYWGSNDPGNAFQWGNSDFHHITNANNCGTSTPLKQQGIIFQSELGSAMNEVHLDNIENNGNYISTQVVTTSALTNGSANIPVPDNTKFPVGLPVWISTSGNPNGFTTSIVYWVVSSSSNIIQLASFKGGTPITSTGTATMNISSQGFSGLEIVGMGQGSGTGIVENSWMGGLDIEANSTALITIQRSNITLRDIGQASVSDGHATIVGRSFSGQILSAPATTSTDFDNNSNPIFFGQRGTAWQNNLYSSGIYYDTTLSMWCMNLFPGNAQANADMCAVQTPSTGPLLKTISPIVDQVKPQDTSKTYTFPDGLSIFNGSSAQTYTLPTITNASNATSMLGYPFKAINASAGYALTILTQSSQTLDNQTGVTSMVLLPGEYGIYEACITAGGTLTWCVKTNAKSIAQPTISSGFGTSPTISTSQVGAFKIVIGSSPGSSGVIGLPTMPNGWKCDASDLTSNSTVTVDQSASTASSATLQAYSRTTGSSTSFVANDNVYVKCAGF